MKKIFLIICIFFLGLVETSFAVCKIQDSEASSLGEYFSNTSKALQIITNASRSSNDSSVSSNGPIVDKFENEVQRFGKAFTVAVNRAFDFDYFFSDFEFNIEIPKVNEVPKEILRDYKMIKQYNDTIKKYYKKLITSKKENIYITDFCKNFDENVQCSIKSTKITTNELMNIIIANHAEVKYLFEQIVAGNQASPTNIQLVPRNFQLDMKTSYGPQSISACNEEGEFLQAIREKSSKIAELEKENKDAIQEWKDAWKLLTGSKDSNAFREIEKDILKKELSRQGVSSDNQTTMLRNLENFNQSGGFSGKNNPFSNTLRSFERKVKNETEIFNKEVLSDFLQGKEEAGVTRVIKISDRSDEKKILITKLQEVTTSLEKYSASTNTTTENFTNQLINSHLEISQSINILNKTCESAVKLCNRQAAGKGNCGTCK